jgi:hypothetical protein
MGQLFKGSKVIAIAQALINAWQGATEALKLPFPSNLAAFASVLATGLGAVQSIKSTNPGSSTGAGAPAAAAAAPAAAAPAAAAAGAPAAQPGTVFQVSLVGDSFSRAGLGSLIDMLNQATKQGHRIEGYQLV